MIKIVKNERGIHPYKDHCKICPRYLLQAKSKDGQIYYAKIGIGEILYYIKSKIKGTF